MKKMKEAKIKVKYNKYIDPKKFEQWKIGSLQLSSVVKVSEREELIELTKDFLSRFQLKLRNCYDRAFQCSVQCYNVNFVLGYVIRGNALLIAAHAWNKYKDVEFDLLRDLYLNYSHTYYKIVEITANELVEIMLSERRLEDFIIFERYYEKYVATDKDFATEPGERADITVLDVVREKWKGNI